jgi:hypothetical protein
MVVMDGMDGGGVIMRKFFKKLDLFGSRYRRMSEVQEIRRRRNTARKFQEAEDKLQKLYEAATGKERIACLNDLHYVRMMKTLYV